ncbi:MAG: hypothetical protein ACUVX9_13705 [Anaerolineae bacterium]
MPARRVLSASHVVAMLICLLLAVSTTACCCPDLAGLRQAAGPAMQTAAAVQTEVVEMANTAAATAMPGQTAKPPQATAVSLQETAQPATQPTQAPAASPDPEPSTDPEPEPGRTGTPSVRNVPGTFAGIWDTTYSTLWLVVEGNRVTGWYDYDDGRIEGTLSTDGHVLEGTWTEGTGGEGDTGWFRFTLSEDGDSFEGEWAEAGDDSSQSWSGTRIP